jgi:hypothetical protein
LLFLARFAKICGKNRAFDTGNVNTFFSILITTKRRIARNISMADVKKRDQSGPVTNNL